MSHPHGRGWARARWVALGVAGALAMMALDAFRLMPYVSVVAGLILMEMLFGTAAARVPERARKAIPHSHGRRPPD